MTEAFLIRLLDAPGATRRLPYIYLFTLVVHTRRNDSEITQRATVFHPIRFEYYLSTLLVFRSKDSRRHLLVNDLSISVHIFICASDISVEAMAI